MKKSILVFLVIPTLLIMALLSGCHYDIVVPELPVPPGQDISFSQKIIPIFNSNCNSSGCHSVGGIAPDLTTANAYNELIDEGYINKDNPQQSELYLWVNGDRNTPMPIEGVDQQIVSAILLWIEQGAQNN